MQNGNNTTTALRILMVAPQPFFRPRGTPFSILHRIRALLRLGHTVDLVTYPFGESPDLPGLAIHRASRVPGVSDVPIGPSPAKLLLDLPLLIKAYQVARTRRFDLLHTHEEAGALCAWVARSHKIPHLYDMHSSLPQQFANFGRYNFWPIVAVFRKMERYTLAAADGVIAICPELRDHVVASGYTGLLALIENVLDFDMPEIPDREVEALKQRLGLGDAAVVLYTGTLEPYQGLNLLIGAVTEVQRQAPSARFVIVGGTEEQIAELQRDAADRGVERSVLFVPAVSPTEVFRYHRIADVLVTVRMRGTNTPLKIYQYLRAGKPIVATDIRSHTQVLSHDCAELVSPTVGGVAAGIARVLTNRVRAEALARAASSLAADRYSEQGYLAHLQDLLRKLVAGASGRQAAA